MAIGATQTVSASWTPTTAGDHVITAQLVANDGSVVQQVSQTFTITAPPPPPVAPNATLDASATDQNYQSSVGIQDALASISPAFASDTQSVFSVIDSLRSAIDGMLNGQISNADQALNTIQQNASAISTSTAYVVSGSPSATMSTSSVPSLAQSKDSASSWLWGAYLDILLALRFLVDNAAIFYPFLVLVFFYVLWRVYRRMSDRY